MKNDPLALLEEFLHYTQNHVFLTGKAGTGKTTFLKNFLPTSNKNFVIVAPTGVAAINTGGVTIHSFFQLPLTAFVPSNDYVDMNVAINQRTLGTFFRHNEMKIKLLRELELLVIDEISMVRCDLLDAIDFVLRHIRKNNLPFGGVQVLMVGDLFQLPPIVKEATKEVLSPYYSDFYFFNAKVWQRTSYLTFNLEKVHRQKDEAFLAILNKIREGQIPNALLEVLNQKFEPNFNPPVNEKYIVLTTHVAKAEAINAANLAALPTPLHVFEAKLTGQFPENNLPNQVRLELKEGAQVMFIRNNTEMGYYNGLIGIVKEISKDSIAVETEGEIIEVGKEVWKNMTYNLEEESFKIKEEELGSFSQYPLKTAWAVTVHKSQGLTFDKLIVDLEASFAPGQIYVALSRCRSLDGLKLKSKIPASGLLCDHAIINYFEQQKAVEINLEEELQQGKKQYENLLIQKTFDFKKLLSGFTWWKEYIEETKGGFKSKALHLADEIETEINSIIQTQQNFENHLIKIFNMVDSGAILWERCQKAAEYFVVKLEHMLKKMVVHQSEVGLMKNSKAYLKHTRHFYNEIYHKAKSFNALKINNNPVIAYAFDPESALETKVQVKQSTFETTLMMFKEGKKVSEIAEIRNLTIGTIENHLAKFVLTGDLNIEQMVPEERLQQLAPYFKNEEASLGEIKGQIPFETTFNELRLVRSYLRLESRKEG